MSIPEEIQLLLAIDTKGNILTAWCFCVAAASRCFNHVVAVLYKYCSPACTAVPSGWNKSTKTVIKPKRIRDVVIRKRLCSLMGKMPDDSESIENKRSVELNNFDPRQKLQRTMTEDPLSNLMHKILNPNPCAVFL